MSMTLVRLLGLKVKLLRCGAAVAITEITTQTLSNKDLSDSYDLL